MRLEVIVGAGEGERDRGCESHGNRSFGIIFAHRSRKGLKEEGSRPRLRPLNLLLANRLARE